MPLAKAWNSRQVTREMLPRARLVQEPKSAAEVSPPPKEVAPTPSREKPMAVTTDAATMGLISQRQYLASRPRTPSIRPPAMTAPSTAP